jgi:hypothetical protein
MITVIHKFSNKSWSSDYGVITEALTYKMNINEIWDEKNIVGYIDKPRHKQKFVVTYKGKILGSAWDFGDARFLIEKEINKSCFLSYAD